MKKLHKLFYIDATRRDLLKLGGLSFAGLYFGGLGCDNTASHIPQKPDSGLAEDAGMDAGLAQIEDAGTIDDDAHVEFDAQTQDTKSDDAQTDDAGQDDAGTQVTSPQPFVLLQFSDIHIGAQAFAASALQVATRDLVPIINPDLTLLTGDLVDSGDNNGQWNDYVQIMNEAGLDFNKIYEQPGNHDSKSDLDLSRFLSRTTTGQQTGTLYGYRDLVVDGRRLRLIAINTASGGSWAKNLPGFLEPDQVDELIALLNDDSAIPDATFILGHHPRKGIGNSLSATFTDDDLDRLITASAADAYLFGHVHRFALKWQERCLHVQAATLGNPAMLSTDPGFSLITFDQDLAVQNLPIIKNDDDSASLDWPIVQISHPVDSKLGDNNPRAEVLNADADIPVRALIFAPESPDEVSFRIDEGDWLPMILAPQRNDLYQAIWHSPQADSCKLEVRCRAVGHTRSHMIEIKLQ